MDHPERPLPETPWGAVDSEFLFRKGFPLGSDIAPTAGEWLFIAVPLALGFLIPWVFVHAVGWVARGFQFDRSGGV
jgi:hypothetical protein